MSANGLAAGFRNLETDDAEHLDLWTIVNEGTREDIDWRSVTVSEDRQDGRDPIIARIPRRENPTIKTLQGLFGDGEVHRLRLSFIDASGKTCGKVTIELVAELKRSAVEMAGQHAAMAANPGYRFATMLETQSTHQMALVDRMCAMVEKREAFVGDVLKDQLAATQKMQATLVQAVGSIEAQRAVDPTTVLLRGAWSMAKPWVNLGLEAGMEYVEEQGGFVKVGKRLVEAATNAGAKKDTLEKVQKVLGGVAKALKGEEG